MTPLIIQKVNEDKNWAAFWTAIIQMVKPLLERVVAFTHLQILIYAGDLDATLGKIRILILATYSTANPTEIENHSFASLLRILHNTKEAHLQSTTRPF